MAEFQRLNLDHIRLLLSLPKLPELRRDGEEGAGEMSGCVRGREVGLAALGPVSAARRLEPGA